MKRAIYWHTDEDTGRVRCDLCPHRCLIREGHDGLCRARGVRAGALAALGYGIVSSLQVDPIEKKPLYHFFPGRSILSVGGWGCNFRCKFCQNWTISQQAPPAGGRSCTPEAIVEAAADSIGIAYTYNEPFVAYEFVNDVVALAREHGLKNVMITNGYINPEPAAELLPGVDALNIDIKSMDPEFYTSQCGGKQDAVLQFAAQAHAMGCHVELTNLVIPSLNDSPDLFRRLADWICESLAPSVPLHLSAYRPCYELDIPATTREILLTAYEICTQSLDHVYLGNVLSNRGCDTTCPGCRARLIERRGFRARVTGLRDGTCASCGRSADVISS